MGNQIYRCRTPAVSYTHLDVYKRQSLHNTVNMLLKCIFYSAERSQLLEYNPCEGISAKGGKPTQKKDSLTDQQVEVLLETVKGLPVSYTHLDVYKRQVQDGTVRIYDFSQSVGEINREFSRK